MLASCVVVDGGFEPWSGQTKDYKIGNCCFFAKHTPALTLWSVSSTPFLVSSFWSMKTKNKKKVNQPIQYEQVYGHAINIF
jgi:hypothetical protein